MANPTVETPPGEPAESKAKKPGIADALKKIFRTKIRIRCELSRGGAGS